MTTCEVCHTFGYLNQSSVSHFEDGIILEYIEEKTVTYLQTPYTHPACVSNRQTQMFGVSQMPSALRLSDF